MPLVMRLAHSFLVCRFGKEYLDKKARKTLEITEMAVSSGCG